MSNKESNVTIYNGNNYAAWRTDIRSELLGREVWNVCTTSNILRTRVVDVEATTVAFAAAKAAYVEECKDFAALLTAYRSAKAEYDVRVVINAQKLTKGESPVPLETPEKPKTPDEPEKSEYVVYEERDFIVTVDDADNPGEPKGIQEFRSRMRKAYNILMKSLKPQFKIAVQNFKTAKEIWDYMELTYNQPTAVAKVIMFEEFFSTKMKEGTSLKTHLAWFEQKVAELKTTGYNLDEEMLAIRLLLSLPPEFGSMRAAIESTHLQNVFTLAEVKTAALQDEARRKGMNEAYAEGALCTQRRPQRPAYRTEDTVVSKHVESNSSGGGSASKTVVFCKGCTFGRHRPEECWRLHPELAPAGWVDYAALKKQGHHKAKIATTTGGATRDATKEEKACIATVVPIVKVSGAHLEQNPFILDSGASSHMTMHREHILNYVQFTTPVRVTTANNQVIFALGKGNIKMNMALPDGDKVVAEWHDVLYVPDLSENLFSLPAARNTGMVVGEQGNDIVLYDREGAIKLCATQIGTDIFVNGEVLVDGRALHSKVVLDAELLHKRFGHMGMDRVLKSVDLVNGIKLPKDFDSNHKICDACIQAKQTRNPMSKKAEELAEETGGRTYSDIWGPGRTQTKGGKRYFSTFLDSHSAWDEPALMREKSEVFAEFQAYVEMMEKQHGVIVKRLRSDNGQEYFSNEFKAWCKKRGIIQEPTATAAHNQNGVAERRNRTYMELTRAVMISSNLPPSFWGEAFMFVVYLCNRMSTKRLDGMTPYEVLFGKKPDLSGIRVFGCKAWSLDRNPKGKLSSKSVCCVYMGPSADTPGNHRLYNPNTQKFISSRDVIFDENSYYYTSVPEEGVFDFDIEESESDSEDVDEDVAAKEVVTEDKKVVFVERPTAQSDSCVYTGDEEYLDSPVAEVKYSPPTVSVKAPSKRRSEFEMLNAGPRYTGKARIVYGFEEPRTYKQAMKCPQRNNWNEAAIKELAALTKMNTFSLVPRPVDRKVVGSKWVWKVKINADGTIERYKARLVAQGYSQIPGIDYGETYSPVARWNSIRTLLSVAAHEGYEVYQIDVDSAYLNGVLEEEIYMEQPEGFVDSDHPNYVWKLNKALYGLKQAGKCWNEDVDAYLRKLGFVANEADACIYTLKRKDGTFIHLGLYVDDIIAVCKTPDEYRWLVEKLKKKYAIKELGLAKYILGVAILRDGKNFALSQRTYLLNILDEFGMGECKPLHTPTGGGDMGLSLKVEDSHRPQDHFMGQAEVPGTKIPSESEELDDPTVYRSVVGKLNYAMVATRPDLAFSVSLLGKFMARPTNASWELAKRVLRYVKHTVDYGLVLGGNSDFPSMIHGFSDSDHAGDRDDRKSITGFVFYIFGSPVSWSSRKQQTVALSSTEAEYMALTESTKEAVWMRRFLDGLGYPQISPTVVMGDNHGSMSLAKNPIDHQRTKHIDVKYHFVRDKVEEKIVELRYAPTAEQTADIFTKPLVKKLFEYHREKLNVRSTSSLWGSVSRQN